MSALIQTHAAKMARALNDPNTAAELLHLVARKSKKGKAKIKGGTIAGIVIAIIVIVIVVAIILILLKRRKQKRLAAPQGVHSV
ncbi:hypothetical protein K458DRAFT_435056 [Lentithecium fluviatile CBS 122367]|uniref:Uncharacterized protein n=1 Tax=Lentithecium fluviatile CBS 122367 TaxID=1168545 RepID=A0A6G1IMF5_9PLEO|nr:hypothetical protein K458DRAFT_435056 [Lentithecium fluviatile CBS 122367]